MKINAYLLDGPTVYVKESRRNLFGDHEQLFGNQPIDGGNLLLAGEEVDELGLSEKQKMTFVKRFRGSQELIKGLQCYCLWIADEQKEEALAIPSIARRVEKVAEMRRRSSRAATREKVNRAWRFDEVKGTAQKHTIAVPRVSSERREYVPTELLCAETIISSQMFALYDAPLWNLSIIASKLHRAWVGLVCGKRNTSISYSNTIGWNTFPVPHLSEEQKQALVISAEDILLAREENYPMTIAEMYQPGEMPKNLRLAHEQNDETLERYYIGRVFKNDEERLSHLLEIYYSRC